jgi:pyruvate dehydrogenase E2 component (dihydrolipoamide acetyltransferase)
MYEVKFADIGEGIHEGVIYKIVVEVGQNIKDGDTLYLVETDKVTAEIPSPVEGEIKDIHFNVGDTIHVGDTIMTIDDHDDTVHEVVSEQGSTSVVGDLEISSEVIASSEEVKKKEPIRKKVLATPVARKLAKDLGIDIQTIVGSGPAGRVMKADIYKAHEPVEEQVKVIQTPLYVDEERVTRVKMSQMRKAIAEHMTKSKFTIPHTAVMDEVIVEELVGYRNEVKLLARQKNIKLTYLPFFIKAVVVALKEHPIVNASLEGEDILLKKDIHIGIAVDTPHGLMVPVIKHADQLSLLEIAQKIEDLSTRAQDKSLHLDELHGSTFTITNYGAFGSSFGVPVINYPEAGILGVGKIDKKPVVEDDEIVIRHILPLSMSFDHRIVDGADAGRFMNTVKSLLNNPQLLLLS